MLVKLSTNRQELYVNKTLSTESAIARPSYRKILFSCPNTTFQHIYIYNKTKWHFRNMSGGPSEMRPCIYRDEVTILNKIYSFYR